jgi:hypothetical protein
MYVTVDATDDIAAGKRFVLIVRGRRGATRLSLPLELERADVIRVNALDSRGLQSPDISVRIG